MNLFIRIFQRVEAYGRYFVQKRHAAVRLGLSAHQKTVSAFRQLAYDISVGTNDG